MVNGQGLMEAKRGRLALNKTQSLAAPLFEGTRYAGSFLRQLTIDN
jgi:hypothetical protein